LVDARLAAIHAVEALRQRLNTASAAVQEKARAGDQKAVDAARGELKDLKARIKEGEEAQAKAEGALETVLYNVPNLPHASVPVGKDESANVVVRTVGK